MPKGNGDPGLCLFAKKYATTPTRARVRVARQFYVESKSAPTAMNGAWRVLPPILLKILAAQLRP